MAEGSHGAGGAAWPDVGVRLPLRQLEDGRDGVCLHGPQQSSGPLHLHLPLHHDRQGASRMPSRHLQRSTLISRQLRLFQRIVFNEHILIVTLYIP